MMDDVAMKHGNRTGVNFRDSLLMGWVIIPDVMVQTGLIIDP